MNYRIVLTSVVLTCTGIEATRGSDLNVVPQRTCVRFAGPNGMKVWWYMAGEDGKPQLSPTPMEVPGRYNFPQGAIYRLKIARIPGRAGLELKPTLEVVPANKKTSAFLSHSPVPLSLGKEDLDHLSSGKSLVKVLYLPPQKPGDVKEPEPGEIVSWQLKQGTNPIAEALKRGSILAVLRVGNRATEAPNIPSGN